MNFNFRIDMFDVEMINGNLAVYMCVENIRLVPKFYDAQSAIYQQSIVVARVRGLIE